MSGLLAVAQAQARLLALGAPLDPETVDYASAHNRFLASGVMALRDQPAADLSAMDGFAIRFADLPGPFRLAGSSAAGHGHDRPLAPGTCVRIFTGAALPEGADTVLVQEDAAIAGDGLVRLTGDGPPDRGAHVRARAMDFAAGQPLLDAGTRLTPARIALGIAGGHGVFPVRRRPRVAILSTGDELVAPGQPAPGTMLPASNAAMLAAMLAGEAADVRDCGIVPDDLAALTSAIAMAAASADILVTSGGASVGDHDLVRPAIEAAGGSIGFWRIAMKPGRPLMAGTLGGCVLIGLPGNPASAFVTATLFVLPMLRHLAGSSAPLPSVRTAPLAVPVAATGIRDEYLRAQADGGAVHPLGLQDSGALTSLAAATVLIVRPAGSPPAQPGDRVDCIEIA